MEKLIWLSIVLSVCVLAAGYTDLDDSLNIEAVVKDKPLLQSYLDCLLNRSPCTARITAYKKHITEALTDGCRECNDKERHMVKVFIQTIRKLKNGDYEKIKSMYDPKNHMETTFADVASF